MQYLWVCDTVTAVGRGTVRNQKQNLTPYKRAATGVTTCILHNQSMKSHRLSTIQLVARKEHAACKLREPIMQLSSVCVCVCVFVCVCVCVCVRVRVCARV